MLGVVTIIVRGTASPKRIAVKESSRSSSRYSGQGPVIYHRIVPAQRYQIIQILFVQQGDVLFTIKTLVGDKHHTPDT
jgi:hypothetical protein